MNMNRNQSYLMLHLALPITTFLAVCGCVRHSPIVEPQSTKIVEHQPTKQHVGFATDGTSPEYKAASREKTRLHGEALKELRSGNIYGAADKLEALLKKYPNEIAVLNDLAHLYRRLDKHQKAFECYKLLVHCPPGTVSSTQTDPQVLARYGEYCLQSGDRREAEFAFSTALENTKPGMGSSDPPFKFRIANFNDLRAQALMGAGMKAYFQLNHEDAVEFGREAMKVKPNWDVGRYYLARYYLDVPPVDVANARREFAALKSSQNLEIRKRSKLMWEVLGLPTEKERIRQWEAEHGRKFSGRTSGSQ